MTDKQLKHLKRGELLEMLIEQTEESEKLRAQIAELEARLADRTVLVEKSGSIAEASVALSDVFAKAEDAAKIYLDSIQRKKAETEAQAEAMIRETESRCAAKEQETKAKCEQSLAETAAKVEQTLAETAAKVQQMLASVPPMPEQSEAPEEQPKKRRFFGLFG